MEIKKDENALEVVKSSASNSPDDDIRYREAIFLTAAGIHSLARLALAVTGDDVSDMNEELTVNLESGLADEERMEQLFAQCLAVIESANRRMLSVIIKRNN